MKPKLPVAAKEVFHFRDEYINNRNLRAWSFYDQTDPTKIVDVIITFSKSSFAVKKVKIDGTSVPILSKRELIAMKKAAARPQDREDIKALERL